MAEPVFVQVLGFSDVERHALNTVFRLSADQATHYLLWTPDAPRPAALALVDGESEEGWRALDAGALDAPVKFIWVGPQAPEQAWRTFGRPLHWPHVLQAMDSLYGPPPDLDFDLGFDNGPDTQPPDAQDSKPARRALIVNASLEERLYLRARLTLAGLVQADDAASAADALARVQAQPYALVLLDRALPDRDGWALLAELRAAQPALGPVWATTARASWLTGFQARRAGAQACLAKPFDPALLFDLLQKV